MISFKPIIWFLIGYVFIGFEVLVPKKILLWFVFGALLTCIFVHFKVFITGTGQWLFFGITSIAFLLAWNLYFKEYWRKRKEQKESK